MGFGLLALWIWILRPEVIDAALAMLVLAPVRVLASLWLGSELMHWGLTILRGARGPRSVTHRAVSYCYGTALCLVIPRVGIFIGLGLAVVFQTIALRQAHGTSTLKAFLAVAATWAILLGLLLLAAFSGLPQDEL